MLIALLWPHPAAPAEADRAARFLAAGGHGLLLAPAGPEDLAPARAYLQARGPRLAGLFAEGVPPGAEEIFHETHGPVPAAELPRRLLALADRAVFLSPPTPAWEEALRASGTPAWAVLLSGGSGSGSGGAPPPPSQAPAAGEGPGPSVRCLAGLDALAREIARGLSRTIVSRPDPMAGRLRKMQDS